MDTFQEEDILNAEVLLKRAGVDVGMRVADMGCGREGTFTFTAARLVTQTGQVFALDVVKEVLDAIEAMKVQRGASDNVATIWTDLELLGATQQISDGTIDVGILSDTLFQSEEREDMIRECNRMVRRGGTLLVVEWKPTRTAIGPDLHMRVQPDEIRTIAAKLGLEVTDQFEAGEYHWGMVLRKPL